MTITAAQQSAYDYYISLGWPASSAAAVVGVLSSESTPNLNTGSQGNQATDASGSLSNGQGAYGVASWNGTRQTDLANWAGSQTIPLDPALRQTQLAFVAHEVQGTGAWSVLSNSGATVAQKIAALVGSYERPAASNVAGENTAAQGFASALGGNLFPMSNMDIFTTLLSTDPVSIAGGPISAILGIGGANSLADSVTNLLPGATPAASSPGATPAASSPGMLQIFMTFLLSLIPRFGVMIVGLILILGSMYIFAQEVGPAK